MATKAMKQGTKAGPKAPQPKNGSQKEDASDKGHNKVKGSKSTASTFKSGKRGH